MRKRCNYFYNYILMGLKNLDEMKDFLEIYRLRRVKISIQVNNCGGN